MPGKFEPRLVLKRLIAAPREKVFNAWIDEKHFAASLAGMEQGWTESLEKLAAVSF